MHSDSNTGVNQSGFYRLFWNFYCSALCVPFHYVVAPCVRVICGILDSFDISLRHFTPLFSTLLYSALLHSTPLHSILRNITSSTDPDIIIHLIANFFAFILYIALRKEIIALKPNIPILTNLPFSINRITHYWYSNIANFAFQGIVYSVVCYWN